MPVFFTTSSSGNELEGSILKDPTFTGVPVAPTAVSGTNTTQIATTSFVKSALDLKAPLANPTFTGNVNGITKSMVGLGNVDNTSDASKPVSTATQSALDLKASLQGNNNFQGINSFQGFNDFTGDNYFFGESNTFSKALTVTSTLPAKGSDTNDVATTAYVKREIDDVKNTYDLKVPLANPTFTGVPLAPTAASGTNTDQVATTAFVKSAVDTKASQDDLTAAQDALQTAIDAKASHIALLAAQNTLQTNINDKASLSGNNSFFGQFNDFLGNNSFFGESNTFSKALTVTSTLPAKGSDTNDVATTAYVKREIDDVNTTYDLKAPITNPTFTGVPLAPTAASGTNTDQVATTAFVKSAVDIKEHTSNKSSDQALGNSDDFFPTQKAVKTYVDTQIDAKATTDADTMTKGKIQLAGELAGTAASPTISNDAVIEKVLTGYVPSAAGIVSSTDSIKQAIQNLDNNMVLKADTTYVDQQISNLVGGAPDLLNTLNELSSAIGNDDDFSINLVSSLSSKAPLANPTFTGTVNGITKSMVGLENVDDTSDASKPVSTATQSALDLKAPLSNPNFTGVLTTNTQDGPSIYQYGLGSYLNKIGIWLRMHDNDNGMIQAENPNIRWNKLCINPNGGNVGVGKINPTEVLDVGGVFNATTIKENGTLLSNKYATQTDVNLKAKKIQFVPNFTPTIDTLADIGDMIHDGDSILWIKIGNNKWSNIVTDVFTPTS